MTDVFLIPASLSDGPYTLGHKTEQIFARLKLEARLPVGAMIALKIHIGERGGPVPIPPPWIRPLVDRLQGRGAQPFLTDSCTLYRGARSNAVVHLRSAAEHGFTMEAVGAPFLVADGLLGEAGVDIPVDGKHFQSVSVAAAAARAQGMVVLSHFTGHMSACFGAAIKNLGMGLAARSGKLQQHAEGKPTVDAASCSGCGVCLDVCAAEAIHFTDNHAEIDQEHCTGCGQCVTVCTMEGIQADYGVGSRALQERIAEYALGVVRDKQQSCGYLTFLMGITPNCDCLGQREKPLFADIGILAATDPVAIDQAACDLVVEATGQPIQDWCGRDQEPTWQLAHGEAIGLGSRHYRLCAVAGV